jgi:hypothetical protein
MFRPAPERTMDSLPLNIRERSLAIAQLGSAVLFRQHRECGEAAVSPLGYCSPSTIDPQFR